MRTRSLLLAPALAVALAGCATDRERQVTRGAPEPEVVEGTVVDVLDGSLYLDQDPEGGAATSLQLADDVELIAEDGTAIEDPAILEGREVRVFYDVTGASRFEASRVEVLSAPTEPNGVFVPPPPATRDPQADEDVAPAAPPDPVEPIEPDEPRIGPDLVPDPLP